MPLMNRLVVAAWVVAASAASVGCTGLKTHATRQFATEYSCPEDRVATTEREDVKAATILFDPPLETPPAEVKSDPGRLAKWQADRAKEQQTMRDTYDDFTVFEITGCGHTAWYGCKRAAKNNGNGDGIGCFPGKHPPK